MDLANAGDLFAGHRSIEVLSVRTMAEWFAGQQTPQRLRLPPIQRSLVWRNEQIVNYWDSLMRG